MAWVTGPLLYLLPKLVNFKELSETAPAAVSRCSDWCSFFWPSLSVALIISPAGTCQPQTSEIEKAAQVVIFIAHQWRWFQVHGKGTETLNISMQCYELSFSCRNQEGLLAMTAPSFPRAAWSCRALGVLEPAVQGSTNPRPALPVLCGLGQIIQRCFQTGFCGASVHLDYSPLVQERNECTMTAGVSVNQTLIGSEETSRKDTPSPAMDSSHQTLHT